jgi:CheY-like chemotaxis protein
MSQHSKRLSIFLVEDIPALQRGVKTMLESMNCVVSIASTYSEALKKFDLSFDGVLTDVGLPDGTGFDVVKHIHQIYPESKAILYMYSAYGVDYIKENIGGLRINGYFGKPFSHDDIENFVNAIFQNKRIVALEKTTC